jgi:dTMP kinase
MRKMAARGGVFICVEGLDGCGKTTQAKLLVRRLRRKYDAVYTAEPSRGRIGALIRKDYLHGAKRGSSIVEALLFAADRFEHVENEVLPLLHMGKIVISDRYVYSSLAYQGAAGLDVEWIQKLNEHAIRPDLAIFIDVAPETVVQRLKPKKSVMEDLQTQRNVRDFYVKFAEKGELVEIDGNGTKKEVAESIFSLVNSLLEKRR